MRLYFYMSVLHKSLVSQGFGQSYRHCLVVFLGISYVGEYLCKGLFIVYLAEVPVFFQRFLCGVIQVDVLRGIVVVSLLVYERCCRQPVCERWVLVGPAERYRGNGHHEPGQFERVDNHLRHIYRRSEVAQAEPGFFGEIAECLCI